MEEQAGADKAVWRPVKMEQQFVVKGGMCNKPHVLDTMPVFVSGVERHFCRVVKSESWLLKCGCGPGAKNGILKRSKVIEQLKDKLAEASSHTTPKDSAVAAHDSAVADDPMSMLDEVEDKESPAKKVNFQPKRSRHQVFLIEMPQRPPGLAGTAVADIRQVGVLGKSTNQLWLAVEDVEWLINYVATEVALGGVPQLPDAAVAEGNCEVEGLRVQWNFGAQSWRAEFVSGQLKGTVVHSSVSKMNAAKWVSVSAAVAVEFEQASFDELKEGTRLFLQNYCAGMLNAGEA